MDFTTPIEKLKFVGPFFQKKLHKLKIRNVGDLLFYFPERYEDFSLIKKIDEIKLNEQVCIKGKIIEIKEEKSFQKVQTEKQHEEDPGSGQWLEFFAQKRL